MNIGTAIKELRKKKKLSQVELAELCDMTQTSLSQIESGSRKPNSETMKKLTTFFNVPEILIYMLATELSDIPEAKRDMFQKVYPSLRNMLVSIFE